MPLINERVAGVWHENGATRIVDQTQLPKRYVITTVSSVEDACEAIGSLRVRGAPAIGIFAAYIVADEVSRIASQTASVARCRDHLERTTRLLEETRPTAVNLRACMERLRSCAGDQELSAGEYAKTISAEVAAISSEDKELCERLGEFGASLIPDGARIITHCNTGALCTAGIGTAIGAFYTAHEQGKNIRVYAGETRPLLQGGRLTAWELKRAGIDTVLMTDSMAAQLMKRERIDLVMVGADRIVRNGDTANKIGTYNLAILARHFEIPFYVVAPGTTVDSSMDSGDDIPIEERPAREVRGFGDVQWASEEVPVINPAFDVTPADYISAIITETGIHRPPYSF